VKLVVIGGGPAGLYFALLAKQRIPGADINVYEQNPKGATYGFGIVLADRGLNRFRNAHHDSYAAIVNASFVSRNRIITHPRDSVFIEGGGYGGAIARLRLLEILEKFCDAAGVAIHYGTRIDEPERFSDAELVVGADGVNSAVRRWRQFGTTNYNLTNRLAWYGTKQHFAYPILAFVKTSMGHFVGAAYAYTERMSTFVAECDAATWDRSGLGEMDVDEARLFAEGVFARELDGHPLISNNSLWRQLPVVRNREWYVGNCVLLGDALHSAHPTIGSGTRIAMED
jgi:2-polyprenyl-6-methoxyphenol hydroxylase-like FAD-dependent oxidoreductase